jgi:1-phosphatidylinositol-4-phosphate 5-kinase
MPCTLCYRVTLCKCSQIRFIVMGNIFNAEVPIHQTYDLKGSRQGRFVKDKAKATIWKDLDLDVEIQLSDAWKQRLDRQLTADAALLRAQRVMDYSMLMGIHFKNRDQARHVCVSGLDCVCALRVMMQL